MQSTEIYQKALGIWSYCVRQQNYISNPYQIALVKQSNHDKTWLRIPNESKSISDLIYSDQIPDQIWFDVSKFKLIHQIPYWYIKWSNIKFWYLMYRKGSNFDPKIDIDDQIDDQLDDQNDDQIDDQHRNLIYQRIKYHIW